jgi:hypothetical protein
MNESSLWQYIRKGMMGRWHVTRVESSSGNGFPDVSYGMPGINGHLELKYIKEWPVRSTTLVKLPLRPEQKLWIKVRGEMSGNVWVLVRIYDTFFLLNWEQALFACDGLTANDWHLMGNTTKSWYKSIDWSELARTLGGG